MPAVRGNHQAKKGASLLTVPPDAQWSRPDVLVFLKLLKQVKSPEEIPDLREEFLKENPTCGRCTSQYKCQENKTENAAFCIRYISYHMEKTPKLIEDMFDLYGDLVRGRYKTAQKKPMGSTIRVVRKAPERQSEYILISDDENGGSDTQPSSSKVKGKFKQEIKNEGDVTMAEAGEKDAVDVEDMANEKVDIEKLLLLTALFAMLRDRIRSKVQKFKAKEAPETVEALLSEIEQLDGIGQGFSDALGDVQSNSLEFSKFLH